MKTCLDCKECRKTTRGYFCIAEDQKLRLPIQNLTTDHSQCALFEEVK